jgi:hypothetical protein
MIRQGGLMRLEARSITVTLRADELAVSSEQVARCAGGTRYRMDSSLRKTVGAILERARQLMGPTFVYRVYEVTGCHEGGYVELPDGSIFPFPAGEQDPGMKALAFCVCTTGGGLEEAEKGLMSAGDGLGALFLHAAGVAFLEALSARAHEALQQQAQERHLQTGCRCAPGYGGLDLSCQRRLFDLVDASSIGVRLNASGMMIPAKSVSFVAKWTTSQVPPWSRHKCAFCALPHCPYRL